MPESITHLYKRIPAWVSGGTIEPSEAMVLAALVSENKPKVIVEMGTASGVSTAVLATAAAERGGNWELHSVDVMESCYFDSSRIVGQAALDMLGDLPNVHFHRACSALDMHTILRGRKAEFVFVDASHESPWAAADLLSVLPNLRIGSVVALHDVLLPFKLGYAHQNGARDLFRVWRGQKWIEPSAPNLGLLRFTDLRQALSDVATCLQADWDMSRSPDVVGGFESLLRPFEHVDYPGRDVCRAHFTRCEPEVANANAYTSLSPYPFASASAVHPNQAGEDLCVVWTGLPAIGTRLYFSVYASNISPENPGAVLHVCNLTNRVAQTITLRPRAMQLVDVSLDGSGKVDLELIVARVPGRTAEYAGIVMGRFTSGAETA